MHFVQWEEFNVSLPGHEKKYDSTQEIHRRLPPRNFRNLVLLGLVLCLIAPKKRTIADGRTIGWYTHCNVAVNNALLSSSSH